eukprot:6840893-Lingulodinium_polyedra.AAC.1
MVEMVVELMAVSWWSQCQEICQGQSQCQDRYVEIAQGQSQCQDRHAEIGQGQSQCQHSKSGVDGCFMVELMAVSWWS